jgi:amidase
VTTSVEPAVVIPRPEEFAYVFGTRPPLGTIRPGQPLRIFTEDCFGGLVKTTEDLPSRVCDLNSVNPVTGPIYVQGAQPGDTLAIHLLSITPTRPWAVSATFPHFGALTSSHETATLQPPLDERVWVYGVDLVTGQVRFQARDGRTVNLPLAPMHGTIGVAPAGGQAISTLTSGPHGGNMDTPEVRAGVTVFLGVNVDGGLFGLGDGHARQGDGEVCGVAVEAAMNTTLVVDLLKGVPTPWPRIVSDQHLMVVGAARPLEDAYRIAHVDLTRWVAELTGFDELDAMQLISQGGEATVGNVCDPAYTFVAKYRRDRLPSHLADPYLLAHDQLRADHAH